MAPLPRRRDQRGAALPSPVVIVSVVAVAMAALAFVATGNQPPTEREITPASGASSASPTPAPEPTTGPAKPPARPAIRRDKVYVEVYNNSGISGLAGRISAKAASAGWQVVGSDNWYGTIPATTVYFPARLRDEAKQLALDLGIRRTMPAVAPMRRDRLTVILTADAG